MSYVQQGGGLVMTDQAAAFDDNYQCRQPRGLADLFPEPLADKVLHANPGKGRAVFIPQVRIPGKFKIGMLPDDLSELLNAVRWAAGGSLQAEVDDPCTVTMSLYAQPHGRRLLHLVNYDEARPARNIEVRKQKKRKAEVSSVRFYSGDSDKAQILTFQHSRSALRVKVPYLEVFGLLVFE